MQSAKPLVRGPQRKSTGGSLLTYALGLCFVALSALVATQTLSGKLNAAFAQVAHSFAKAF